jgi:hypothetical protein
VEFVNHTPFGAAAYRGLDVQGREHEVVAARVVYRLVPEWQAAAAPGPPADGAPTVLVPHVIDEGAPGLVTEDQYLAETGRSSVLAESDLAPFKPRCDVLVTGHSHAPYGRAAPQWLARLRVSQPTRHPKAPEEAPHRPPSRSSEIEPDFAERLAWQESRRVWVQATVRAPGPDGERTRRVLLDKALEVHAPRRFVRSMLGWNIERSGAALRVPLLWEHAYGGRWQVRAPNAAADAPALLDEVCYLNPLGCGWMPAELESALRDARQAPLRALPAPQFEYSGQPVQAPDVTPQPPGLTVAQMAEQARRYRHRPAGFGPLGRAWTPRIQLAGRYDQHWLDERWPGLPQDFDMGYWCAAPADQQIEFPEPDAYIELGNLIDPQMCPSGHAVIPLPGHVASVLFHTAAGLLLGGPCVIDTLAVDTDAMTLAVVWRASVLHDADVKRAELRYSLSMHEPLFTAPAQGAAEEVYG